MSYSPFKYQAAKLIHSLLKNQNYEVAGNLNCHYQKLFPKFLADEAAFSKFIPIFAIQKIGV